MEVLGHTIHEVVDKGKWKVVKAARAAPRVSHLMFADDLLLFSEAIMEQAKIVKGILQDFC